MCRLQLFSLLGLLPQQLTGLSERKRSTGGKNSEAFRALGWTADGENSSLVCVHVGFFYYGDQNMLYYATLGSKTTDLELSV